MRTLFLLLLLLGLVGCPTSAVDDDDDDDSASDDDDDDDDVSVNAPEGEWELLGWPIWDDEAADLGTAQVLIDAEFVFRDGEVRGRWWVHYLNAGEAALTDCPFDISGSWSDGDGSPLAGTVALAAPTPAACNGQEPAIHAAWSSALVEEMDSFALIPVDEVEAEWSLGGQRLRDYLETMREIGADPAYVLVVDAPSFVNPSEPVEPWSFFGALYRP